MVKDKGEEIDIICDKLEAVPESKWYSEEGKGFYTQLKGLNYCLSGYYDKNEGASEVALTVVNPDTERPLRHYTSVPAGLVGIFESLAKKNTEKRIEQEDADAERRLNNLLNE